MRRITLILSDLYLPEDTGRGAAVPVALDLPHLDGLLRFARRPEPIHDWRSWLGAELGATQFDRVPVAQCCALRLPSTPVGNAWLATPVHLEARLDHVRLADRGLLRMHAEERLAWCAEFAQAFGPDYALNEAGECGFLLTGLAGADIKTVDPARLLDADVGGALPSGPAARELRRLGTEIEMWLHGAKQNASRELVRARRVSALWIWGGGPGEAGVLADAPREIGARFLGRDPYLLALAAPAAVPPAPRAFEALDADATHVVVELAPMSGPEGESLAALDANWFSPVREALNAGSLESVDLIANDRCFRVGARAGWRVWRRRRPWLAQFARQQ